MSSKEVFTVWKESGNPFSLEKESQKTIYIIHLLFVFILDPIPFEEHMSNSSTYLEMPCILCILGTYITIYRSLKQII